MTCGNASFLCSGELRLEINQKRFPSFARIGMNITGTSGRIVKRIWRPPHSPPLPSKEWVPAGGGHRHPDRQHSPWQERISEADAPSFRAPPLRRQSLACASPSKNGSARDGHRERYRQTTSNTGTQAVPPAHAAVKDAGRPS
jgi:hypothetical protein